MRYLFEFAERAELRQLVGQVTEFKSVQGVVVDYDPIWLALWRVKSAFGDRAVLQSMRALYDWGHYFGTGPWPLNSIPNGLLGADVSEIEPADPTWIPPDWIELQKACGRDPVFKEPFVVKVCLLPKEPDEKLPEFGKYSFPVIKERRSLAALTMPLRQHRPLVGGVSIGLGPADSGTLGGIVEDQHKKRWGVTCAHVVSGSLNVDQPAQCDNSTAGGVGSSRHKSILSSSSASTPCNPYNSSASLNVVDAALIEFSAGIASNLEVLNQGTLSGITSKSNPSPGQLIEMAGKQSGSRVLEVGGLAVTYRLRDASGNLYCFKELFEIRWPRWWRVLGGRPVQRGDSGAWLLGSQATGNEWVGMAIAGDRLIGYATFAQNIVDWAKTTHSLDLRVV